MLAIGQALMADPKLLLLDEPTLGLAATFVPHLRQIILEINHQGTGVLLVEQNASMALVHRRPRLRPRDRPDREGRVRRPSCWPTRTSRSSTSVPARPDGARSAT